MLGQAEAGDFGGCAEHHKGELRAEGAIFGSACNTCTGDGEENLHIIGSGRQATSQVNRIAEVCPGLVAASVVAGPAHIAHGIAVRFAGRGAPDFIIELRTGNIACSRLPGFDAGAFEEEAACGAEVLSVEGAALLGDVVALARIPIGEGGQVDASVITQAIVGWRRSSHADCNSPVFGGDAILSGNGIDHRTAEILCQAAGRADGGTGRYGDGGCEAGHIGTMSHFDAHGGGGAVDGGRSGLLGQAEAKNLCLGTQSNYCVAVI